MSSPAPQLAVRLAASRVAHGALPEARPGLGPLRRAQLFAAQPWPTGAPGAFERRARHLVQVQHEPRGSPPPGRGRRPPASGAPGSRGAPPRLKAWLGHPFGDASYTVYILDI